jgi:hypothetical protein
MKVTKLVLLAGAGAAAAAVFAVSMVSSSSVVSASPAPAGVALNCNLTQYKASAGLTSAIEGDLLTVSWNGQGTSQLRAQFAINGGTPTIHDLSVRRGTGEWASLGQNLTPEYRVTTGMRRMSDDQANAMSSLGIDMTQDVIDKYRWYAFWDAPLSIPGYNTGGGRGGRGGGRGGGDADAPVQGRATPALGQGGTIPEQVVALQSGQRGKPGYNPPASPPGFTGGRGLGLPRKQEEIRRGVSEFSASSCEVKSDGASLAVTFPGLKLGIFDGNLRFTVYRGTNLIQMDALAKTNEPWVAYKYDAGLKGFSTAAMPRVIWRDTGGHPQQHQFGGPKSNGLGGVRAQNRLLVAEGPKGSVATFPPPHTFFFTREVDINLGYVFHRNDGNGMYSIGVTMPEAESDTTPGYAQNYALYNAPPGTVQKMSMYFYASPEAGEATRQAALAFTHEDVFKAVPGYKTFVNHFHLDFTGRQRVNGFDTPFQDLMAMKAIGLNIIGLSDFHFELNAGDWGPLRFKDQKDYFEASRRASDKDFLVVPWEEPSVAFGGHYNILWPKAFYWSKVNRPGGGRGGGAAAAAAGQAPAPFTENDPTYGKVYHAANNATDMQKILDAENGYWYSAHPRTKSTAGFPDATWGTPYLKNDRYLGVAFKPGMGQDNSQATMCEWRCFDAVDTMNNMYADLGIRPKYVIADIDTYRKNPEDDTYANFPVNYLKIESVPGPDQDWSPVLKSLRDGSFFVSTGEILIKNYALTGTGNQRTITADVEWTFPMAFMEIVSGDGKTVSKQVISATDMQAFSAKKISVPFDATGKKWVRFSMWDVAGNGGFTQAQWLTNAAAK